MPKKVTSATITGLSTQPNVLSGTPPGSLRVADNVVIRRAGTLEPAPKLNSIPLNSVVGTNKTVLKTFADALDNNVISILVDEGGTSQHGTALHVASPDLSGQTFSRVRDWDSSPNRPLVFAPGRSYCTSSRDRRILTSEGTPLCLTRSTSGASWELRIAGLQQPGGLRADSESAAATLAAVAPPKTHAYYRAVFYRKYEHYELKSPPTSKFLYSNLSTTDAVRQIRVRVAYNDETTPSNAGDICIVYRTRFTKIDDGDPGDSFQEVGRGVLTAADVTDGSIDIRDRCPDAQLGAALYTNSTQLGADQANYPPPDSRCVVTHRDTTYYVINRDWPSMSFGINDFGDIDAGAAVGRSLVHNNAAIAAGQNYFNIVDATALLLTRLTPGMVVAVTGTSGNPADTPVGIVSTVTNLAGVTGIGIVPGYGLSGQFPAARAIDSTIYICDSIVIDVVKYDDSTAQYLHWFSDPDPWSIARWWSSYFSRVRSIVVADTSVPAVPGVNLTLTTNQAGRFKRFSISCTHGSAYTQTNLQTSGLATLSSEQYEGTSRVYFSKTSEPEAVPAGNLFDVGQGTILRLLSDNNNLYAFCSDGLYRITGQGVPTIIQLSRTHLLMHPDAACVLDGMIFAWCTSGVYAITEAGPQNISDAAIGPMLRGYVGTIPADSWGTYMVANDAEREVYLCSSMYVPSYGTWGGMGTYCFNARTASWVSRSSVLGQGAAYVPGLNKLYFASNFPTDPRLWFEDETLGWEDVRVVFNPFTAKIPGTLKQWIDVNLLAEDALVLPIYDIPPEALPSLYLGHNKTQFLFDNNYDVWDRPVNVRLSSAHSFLREHCWVPRRAALRDTLTVGFETKGLSVGTQAQSMYFKLNGITLRYRLASETFQV